MPNFTTSDGVMLHYEEAGQGHPVVFAHEFAGDGRSYEPQVRFFARRYRCITYNARGYPPSSVLTDPAAYSQDRARDDLRELFDHLRLEAAHVVGVSMGGFTALHAAMTDARRLSAIVVAGSGYGAYPPTRARFQADTEATAAAFLQDAIATARRYAAGSTRLPFARKDARGYAEFVETFLRHPPQALANTLRGVQCARPSLWDLEDRLAAITVPTLIVTGDEDEGCLEPALLLKRTIPAAGLLVLPMTGHTINLEEPAAFNLAVLDFFHQAEAGTWPKRGPTDASAPTDPRLTKRQEPRP